MAVDLLDTEGSVPEDARKVRVASNSTAKSSFGRELTNFTEMNERKRKLPALRTGKGLGSNVLASKLCERRPGLYQILASEEGAGFGQLPVRLSPTGLADSTVPSYQSEVSAEISPGRQRGPGNEAWHLPDINQVSQRFAESASNLGRCLANIVEENVTRDIRRNLIDSIAGTSVDTEPSTSVSEHERICVNLSSASTPTSPTSQEANRRLLENGYALSNISVERATSLFSSTGAAMMDMGQQFLSVPPTVWNGLVTRVQTTLRGSADDIGWLVNSPDYPTAEDGTEDFLKALEQIGRGIHILPNTLTYLLVPGLFSNHGPLYFFDTKKHFAKLGLPCHIAKIHSESAVEKNAREIKDHIEELYKSTGRKVVLLGHSKGGVDAAATCSMFWPQLKEIVVGIVLVQSPYGGSPIASDILREGQIADVETRRIIEILISRLFKGDIQSLEDLTYDKRREFLTKYPLPPDVPIISFHTEASRAPRAVSVMSHIAHAQLPWLPGMTRGRTSEKSEESEGVRKLHVAVPLAAAMAICALHLELRYKEKSDGLVTRKDAEVPGSIVVKPEKKLDHAWMVYAPSRREPNEPDAAQMCEALIAVLLNLPRCREGEVPVTEDTQTVHQEPAESVADTTAATSQDQPDFLTTDAARSFLGDSDGGPNETAEDCHRSTHSSSDRCESMNLGMQRSDVERLTAEAARISPGKEFFEGTSSRESVECQELPQQISCMVVLKPIARVLQGEINNAHALSDQSNQRDISMNKAAASPIQANDKAFCAIGKHDARDNIVEASTQ